MIGIVNIDGISLAASFNLILKVKVMYTVFIFVDPTPVIVLTFACEQIKL